MGETPAEAIVRMGDVSRGMTVAMDEASAALTNSIADVERDLKALREAAADSDLVRESTVVLEFLGELRTDLVDPVEFHPPRSAEIKFRLGHLIPTKELASLTDALQLRWEGRAHDLAARVEQRKSIPDSFTTWRDAQYPAVLDQLADVQANGIQVVASPRTQQALFSRLAQRLARNVQESEAGKKAVQEAAGETGQEVIGQTFGTAADTEAASAKWWTAAVVVLVLLGLAGTLAVVHFENDLLGSLDGGWGLIFKALVGLPLYGLAAYCAHVAGEHRTLARHFRILAVQLRAVGAYIEPLLEDQRSELRMILGRQAFSSPTPADAGRDSLNPAQAELTALLGKALDLIKGGGKGSE